MTSLFLKDTLQRCKTHRSIRFSRIEMKFCLLPIQLINRCFTDNRVVNELSPAHKISKFETVNFIGVFSGLTLIDEADMK